MLHKMSPSERLAVELRAPYPGEHAGGWTAERVDALTRLWSEGLSCSQIAAALGQGATRNAVIGKSHRLKLPRRAPFKQANNGNLIRKKRERAAKPKTKRARRPDAFSWLPSADATPGDPKIAKGPAWAALPSCEPIPMDALTQHTCRWPIGDDRPYSFCGAESEAGSSYCATHAARSTGAGSSYERQAIAAAKAIGNDEVRNGLSTFAARDAAA